MKEEAEIWQPVADITSPCADISYAYADGNARVTMHFSRVSGQARRDLVLHFQGVISLRAEEESCGLVPFPASLPKCPGVEWSEWTYPLLRISSSSWWQQHLDTNPVIAEGRVHYALVSMNDLVQLLCKEDVLAEWVVVQQETEQAVAADRPKTGAG